MHQSAHEEEDVSSVLDMLLPVEIDSVLSLLQHHHEAVERSVVSARGGFQMDGARHFGVFDHHHIGS